MPAPENRLKQDLTAGRKSIGAWLNLGSGPVAEMAAGSGFDWCVIDGEHGPFDVTVIRDQLIALRAGGCDAVVRVPTDARWVIKQVLDLGAQSILVPMVDTAEQARAAVAATRYPPKGTRGVGASVARASGYGGYSDYTRTADQQIAVIVQVETRRGPAQHRRDCRCGWGGCGVYRPCRSGRRYGVSGAEHRPCGDRGD